MSQDSRTYNVKRRIRSVPTANIVEGIGIELEVSAITETID
jgi:hypothetical protein